jgi:hypothetical protein
LQLKIQKSLFTDLIISFPWWFVLLVILIGASYASILYFKNRKNKLGKTWTILLFVTRFLSVSLLTFLLLSPFIKSKSKQLEKPVVVIGLDNSRSMVLVKDSAEVRTNFSTKLENIIDRLREKYDVEAYTFGGKIQQSANPDFRQETSNYADFILKMKEDYTGTNFGALVIVGDGINNRGIDPVFAASDISFPIYTIALGDTTTNRDLKINDVRVNRIIYLGDDFPVEVNVIGHQLNGEKAVLKVYAYGKLQHKQNININSNSFNQTFSFTINAKDAGKQRLGIKIETEAGELNKGNNERNVFIDVLDNRQKILLLAAAPHPDLAAIRKSIEANKNFQLDLAFASDFKGKPEDYDLVILHQIPSNKLQEVRIIQKIIEKNIPLLFILGKQSNIALFNQYYKGIDFKTAGVNFEDAQAVINPTFSLFKFDPSLAGALEKFPPLIVQLGNYQVLPATTIFATQKINNLETGYPLIAFSSEGNHRNGFIAGEGLWMWRLHDYLQNNNTKAFDTFIEKTIQLLLLRKDKRFFRVDTQGEYTGNENVIIDAELYDQSYEPVNEPDVNFILINENAEKFDYLFSPSDKSYKLDLGRLPVGIYKYSADTKLGREKYKVNGEFVVNAESLESRTLKANHNLLYRLANQHGGEMLYPSDIDQLPEILDKEQNLQSKIYYEEKYTGLFNLWSVIGLILFLLSLEWFLRKYFGSY